MQREIEAKFLNIDIEDIRRRLFEAGGTCTVPMRLMRRVVIDHPDHRMGKTTNGWIRVRDEGDRVTLTYKMTDEHVFGGSSETEVEVSDYQKTIDIFLAMGLAVRSDQETKRETWRLDGCEVTVDEWPWLRPFIEIEGSTKAAVRAAAKQLGFDWADAVFGSVTVAYRRQYPSITHDDHISAIPEIKFGIEKPEWFVKEKVA